ncbi:hypothetical protein BB560_003541, partial [Smittium megazygosporum]
MINYETTQNVTSKEYIDAMNKADDIASINNSMVNYIVGSSYVSQFMSAPTSLLNYTKFRLMNYPPSKCVSESMKDNFYAKKLLNMFDLKTDSQAIKRGAKWTRRYLESISKQETTYFEKTIYDFCGKRGLNDEKLLKAVSKMISTPVTYTDYKNSLFGRLNLYWDSKSQKKYYEYQNLYVLNELKYLHTEGLIKVIAEEGIFDGIPKQDVGRGFLGTIIISGRLLAPALSNFILDLTLNQKVFYKLAFEQKKIIEKYENDITLEALDEMVYLDACILESMRLGSMSGIPRFVEKDMYLPNGVKIKEKSFVKFGRFTHNRSEKYFLQHPHYFIPERHLKTNTKLS